MSSSPQKIPPPTPLDKYQTADRPSGPTHANCSELVGTAWIIGLHAMLSSIEEHSVHGRSNLNNVRQNPHMQIAQRSTEPLSKLLPTQSQAATPLPTWKQLPQLLAKPAALIGACGSSPPPTESPLAAELASSGWHCQFSRSQQRLLTTPSQPHLHCCTYPRQYRLRCRHNR